MNQKHDWWVVPNTNSNKFALGILRENRAIENVIAVITFQDKEYHWFVAASKAKDPNNNYGFASDVVLAGEQAEEQIKKGV